MQLKVRVSFCRRASTSAKVPVCQCAIVPVPMCRLVLTTILSATQPHVAFTLLHCYFVVLFQWRSLDTNTICTIQIHNQRVSSSIENKEMRCKFQQIKCLTKIFLKWKYKILSSEDEATSRASPSVVLQRFVWSDGQTVASGGIVSTICSPENSSPLLHVLASWKNFLSFGKGVERCVKGKTLNTEIDSSLSY